MLEELSNRETVSDAALVERARGGERAAFSALVGRHQTTVYRICYRILGDPEDAADAAQEAFLRAYRNLDGFRGQSAFKTWLTRLTVNVSLNERERRKPSSPLDESHAADTPRSGLRTDPRRGGDGTPPGAARDPREPSRRRRPARSRRVFLRRDGDGAGGAGGGQRKAGRIAGGCASRIC